MRPPQRSLYLALVLALVAATSAVHGQASQNGQWSSVFTMPLVAVHGALMHTGRVLFFDAWEIPGTPSARLWDPASNTYTSVANNFAELFCAGHVLTPDGRLLTAGGHNGAGVGTTDSTFFDPTTLQWTALDDLNYARWYPSVTPLADGRTLTVGGAISRPNIAEVPEVLSSGGSQWTAIPGAQKDVGEYPQLYQAPDGRVFVSGADGSYSSWMLDVDSGGWTSLGQGPAGAGNSVMYRPGQVMMTGGGTLGSDPVTEATGVIDLTASSPAWRETGPMVHGRSQHTLVIMPDGKVLVVGGAAEVSLISTNGVLPAEIWDPDTEQWTEVAAMTRPRMYHSIALLLPDGRILAAGGGRLGPDELNGQFYSPPYLFRGARPVLSSAPQSVGYGETFSVSTPDPGSIARVTFVRASSVTHGLNLDQRFVELSFTESGGGLNVVSPFDTRSAPAGDYLLFLLNDNDVPSLGRIVRLGGGDPPSPTVSIGDASVNEGTASGNTAVFTVTRSGSTAQSASVTYATADGTAIAGVDYAARSGTITFPAGATTRTISIPTIADATTETNETFEVTLLSATNAAIGRDTGIGTIVDDDAPLLPALSINSVSVTEGTGGGTPVAGFTVSLSAASAQSVLVSYRTLAGSAQSPADYTSTTGTLTFAGGVTSQTIQVPVVPDALDENNETFSVELYDVVRAVVGTGVGTATIVDDDGGGGGSVTATYVVAAGADDVNEDGASFTAGDGLVWLGTASVAGGGYLGLRFTGVGIPAGATVTAARLEVHSVNTQWNQVAFEMGVEASTNSAPLTAASRPSQRTLLAPRVAHDSDVQWLAGSTVALEDISALIGAVVQQPGWVAGRPLTLVLRGTGGLWSRKHVASRDNGAATAPRLVVTYTTGGGGGNQPPTITSATATPTAGTAPLPVSFNGAATDPEGAALSYAWSFGDGGSATGPTANHTYAAGTYAATLTVSDGTLTATSAPLAITVGAAATPTLSVSDASVTEGTGAGGSAVFTVTLANPSGGTVTVAYGTAAGTATAPGDFTATSGTLSFSGATTTRTVTVPVVGDATVEGAETFTVQLSAPSGAVIGDGAGTGTIVDDDTGGGGGPVTATYVVAAGADDVNEDGASFTAGDGLVWLGTASVAGGGYLGLRFTGVGIPAGATVTAARLEVHSVNTQWNQVAFEMGVEASTNSAPLTAASRPSQRTLLAPRVAHDSDVQWLAGSTVALEDISALIGAVVQQPGWVAGRPLTLVLRGTGGLWSRKHVASRDNGAATAPRLVVTYTTGGGGGNQPPTITSATATPTAGTAPLPVSFNGAATDPEGAALSYAWSFGDGGSATGPTANHTYAAGTYAATLTVSDGTLTATSAPLAITVGAAATPTLSVSDASVTEGTGAGGSAVFTVTLANPSGGTVTVAYGTAAGTATAPGDFTATSGTLSFSGATTTRTVTVPVVGDATVEGAETFTVQLSAPSGAVIGDGAGTGTIVDDDTGGGGGPVTATYVVAAGADDVNEDGASFTAGDGLVWLGTASVAGGGYLGLRFTGVGIPAGATVTAARLEVHSVNTQWNQVAFEMGVEASTNSAPLTAASRPSQRTLLAPRVAHDSDVQWLAGSTVALEDISALIGAVVQQPGWVAGRPLTLVLRGTGGLWSRKHVASRDNGAATAPRLVVTYTTP